MLIRPFASQASSRLLCIGIVFALLATVVSCSSSVAPAGNTKQDEADSEYAVPDGTPKEIIAFVTKLQKRKPEFASEEEMVNHAVKVHGAIITAAEKILAQKPDDELAERAAGMKLSSLITLAANQVPGSAKAALDAVALMKQDSNKIVAGAAAKHWQLVRILNVGEMNQADRSSLTDEVLTAAEKKKFDRTALAPVVKLGQLLEESPDPKEAVAYYTKVADLIEHHGASEAKELGEQMRGIARRVGLPGNEMQLDATLVDGQPFDWASYRGKVVLVDFWATWCGPCLEELPNVKANYSKYHDRGFDVVGISLDKDKRKLKAFIEREELPWAQLYDEEIQKGTGWNHPVAKYYGISSVPTAILVDQKGRVVSMEARGPELGKQLEKLLGKAE